MLLVRCKIETVIEIIQILIPGVVGGEPPHPFLAPVVQTDPQAFTELRDQVSDDTVEIVTSQTNVLASELLKQLVFVNTFYKFLVTTSSLVILSTSSLYNGFVLYKILTLNGYNNFRIV